MNQMTTPTKSSNAGTASAQKQDIPDALDNLSQSRIRLQELLSVLQGRLQPIMRTQTEKLNDTVRQSGKCEVSERLREEVGMIEGASFIVQVMLDLLEI